jgi:hypothetical protein
MLARTGRRTWRNGGRPTRDVMLTEKDRDLLEECDTAAVCLHIAKLRGEAPYSMSEVKPRVSAALLEGLLRRLVRLRQSKSVAHMRELETVAKAQKRELLRLWKVESKYKALTAQRELPFVRESSGQ